MTITMTMIRQAVLTGRHVSGSQRHGDGGELLLQQGAGHQREPVRTVAPNHQQTTTLRLYSDDIHIYSYI